MLKRLAVIVGLAILAGGPVAQNAVVPTFTARPDVGLAAPYLQSSTGMRGDRRAFIF